MTNRGQIPDILYDLQIVPVFTFRPTGRRYFILGMVDRGISGEMEVELLQYQFDPVKGDLYELTAFKQSEKCGVRPWRKPDGTWGQRYFLLRFDPVDWRFVEPPEILAVQEALMSVVSSARKNEMKRALGWLREENVHYAMEQRVRAGDFRMTEATTPENPEIETTPRTQIVITRKMAQDRARARRHDPPSTDSTRAPAHSGHSPC